MMTRIVTGALLLVILLSALHFGGRVFSVLWIAALCLAMYELYHAFAQAGHRPVTWPSWACLIVSIPSFMLMQQTESLFLLVVTFCITFLAVAGIVMFRREPRLEDLLISLMPVTYIVIPGLSMLGILRVDPVLKQQMLMACVFLIPILGDAGAYFIGVKFGKTKLIPAVSPKKTVEGAAGGLLFSTLGALGVYAAGSMASAALPPVWHFILLGLAGGIVGQLGDLFASLIKRHCQVKDFGKIFPGHGGMMDRLDSILFVAVLVYLYQAVWR